LGRKGIPQGFITMSSGRGGRNRQLASPLAWTSYHGVKDVKAPRFQERLSELLLQYPGSKVARKAAAQHVAEVQAFVKTITEAGMKGRNLADMPLQAPGYPEAGKGGDVPTDTIPTYAYNWNVSPLTPVGVAGVIWIPSEANLPEDPAHYASELEIYAKSLQATYGQDKIPFFYTQPAGSLVEGITSPKIPGSRKVPIKQWPKSLKSIAEELGKLAAGK